MRSKKSTFCEKIKNFEIMELTVFIDGFGSTLSYRIGSFSSKYSNHFRFLHPFDEITNGRSGKSNSLAEFFP